MRSISMRPPNGSGRALKVALVAAIFLAAAGCTPQAAFLAGLLPDGTISALLSHVDATNEPMRKLVYDMETRKDWNGLAKLADDSLAINHNHADWWFISGYAHAEAKRPGRAADSFGNLVRLAPDEPANWRLFAQALRESKQPQRAVQALNTAHQLRRGTPASYYLLGESYSDLDRDLPAISAYREALQIDSDFAKAWFGLGRASARLGRKDDYESALKSLNRLDPKLAKELTALRPAGR
jgi:predicted Zn-dependent protease